MQPRIGLINIGHPDYPNDIGVALALQAVEALGHRGIEIVWDGAVCTDPLTACERGREMCGRRLDGAIVWLGTWIECSTAVAAIREIEHLPFAIWGFNMLEVEGRRESTGSFVAAAVLKGSLERMGYRFPTILGLPGDESALTAAVDFSHAAYAAGRLRRTRLGLVGYASMSMYPGTFDHVLLRRIIGPEVVHIDTYTLVRNAEQASEDAVQRAAAEISARARVQVTPERLHKASRLAVALETLAARHGLQALNVKCQYELSQEWGMTPCVALSLLADKGIACGCEGDVPASVTMCLLSYLQDDAVVFYGDILDLQGDEMLLSSCGFAPLSLAHEPEGATVRELGHPGFDGIICSCTMKEGPVTFARLVEGRGDWHLVFGTGTGLPCDLRQGRFPALQVRLDGDPERLLETLSSQHFALCYGDATRRIEKLCAVLGIELRRV